MADLQGQLLVAPPQQNDPDFARVVILLIQHSPEQAVGVVLNRPSSTTVRQLYKQACRKACDCGDPAFTGGPVPGPVMALHTCEPLSDLEVLPGVYYAVKKNTLEALAKQTDCRRKLFDSHCGWGPSQLDQQIDAGLWRVVPATVEHVFHAGGDLWQTLVEGQT